jgi:hypothetical protein
LGIEAQSLWKLVEILGILGFGNLLSNLWVFSETPVKSNLSWCKKNFHNLGSIGDV